MHLRRFTPARRRNRARRLLGLTLVLLLVAPWMVGCVRIRASLTISPDDTVSGQIIAAAKPRSDADPGPQLDPEVSFRRKVAVSKYKRDGYVGSQAVFSDLTFGELPQLASLNPDAAGVSLTLRRAGDLVILEGRVDLTSLEDSEADLTVTVTFPGEVISTDGAGSRISSDTAQWSLDPGVVNTLAAQARYTDPSTRSFHRATLWLALMSIAVAAAVAALAWRSRDTSPGLTAPDSPDHSD